MVKSEINTSIRAIRLFEEFARAQGPQTLSEISKRIGSPLSTCHNLVKALQETGYLYTSKSTRRHYPTKRLLRLTETIAANDPIVPYFEVIMTQLRDVTGETIILGARQKDEVVYLEVRESQNVIRYSARAGDLKPLHSSALGKMFLGEMDEPERTELLKRMPLNKVTEKTLTDPQKLFEDLTMSREKGVYSTSGENVSEVKAFSAPVRVAGELYGLVVAGPIQRISEKADDVSARLVETCSKIEAELF